MPAQQRRRLHEQAPPRRTGRQPRQPGQHRPVGSVSSWPGDLASQHRDLVAQHQQLGVLGGRTSRQQHKPPQHLAEQQIEQSKWPCARSSRPGNTSGELAVQPATTDFLAPTRSASEGAARTSGHGLWVGSSRTRTANQGSALRPAGVGPTPSRTPRRPASPSQPAPAAELRSVSAGQPGCGAPAGIEPATPSLWNHQKPLCEPPFPQVPLDRRAEVIGSPNAR